MLSNSKIMEFASTAYGIKNNKSFVTKQNLKMPRNTRNWSILLPIWECTENTRAASARGVDCDRAIKNWTMWKEVTCTSWYPLDASNTDSSSKVDRHLFDFTSYLVFDWRRQSEPIPEINRTEPYGYVPWSGQKLLKRSCVDCWQRRTMTWN